MAVISGKRAFLELLRQEGVEFIFGNPGTTELPLMDALAVETDIRYVLGLQEATVLAMAGGYAQASGKLAVASLHVTPGLGNAMGMLYDAQKANAPVLVTAGQHEQSFNLTEPILWGDLVMLARPLVKWSVEVHRLADLPRILHRAATTALAPPMGPVFVSLPGDVLNAEAELDLGAPTRVAPAMRGDPAAVAEAARLLAAAERPVILAGDAVATSDALTELVALAEAVGAPVYIEGVANRACFPASHPLFAGTMGRLAPTIRETLSQHDLVFSAGADLYTLSLPAPVEPVPADIPIVHLDSEPWQLGKNYPTKVAILGDPRTTLPDLMAALRDVRDEAGEARARERGTTVAARLAAQRRTLVATAEAGAEKQPILAPSLLHAIGEALPPDAIVVDETISSAAGIRQFMRSDDARSFFGMRGGGIGWGLPAALGVKLAQPRRPVVALIGDGSAMYTIQALWSAAHDRIAVVFVILNNSSYRILKQRTNALQGHAAQRDRYVAMDLEEPRVDFLALARSLGVPAERAVSIEEVRALLARGLAADGPVLIDVEMDRSFKPV